MRSLLRTRHRLRGPLRRPCRAWWPRSRRRLRRPCAERRRSRDRIPPSSSGASSACARAVERLGLELQQAHVAVEQLRAKRAPEAEVEAAERVLEQREQELEEASEALDDASEAFTREVEAWSAEFAAQIEAWAHGEEMQQWEREMERWSEELGERIAQEIESQQDVEVDPDIELELEPDPDLDPLRRDVEPEDEEQSARG
jgi:hypothetical protein